MRGRLVECVGQPTHSSLPFLPSPAGVEAQSVDKDEDRSNFGDPVRLLFPQGRRLANVEV